MDNEIKKSYEKINLSEESKNRIQLAVMMDKKKYGRMKTKWNTMNSLSRAAAVLVMVLVLGSGSVFAASRIFSIKDFIKNLPKDAEQYINTNVSVDNVKDKIDDINKNYVVSDEIMDEVKDKVSFAVKETVSDSKSCHISVEATLEDPEHYLMIPDCSVSEHDNGGSAREYYSDARKGESIEEYAARMGKQILYVESSFSDDEFDSKEYMETVSGKFEDESHVLLHLEVIDCVDKPIGIDNGMRVDIINRVSLYVNKGEIVWQKCKNENMTVTLEKVAEEEDSASYALADGKEMRVGDGPVIIKSIKLTNTPLETKVEFIVVNEDKELGNWVGINLIDDEGQIFDQGTSSGGSASVPSVTGQFTDTRSYKKMEFPDHVNVRVRDLNTDDIYELKNIPIVK